MSDDVPFITLPPLNPTERAEFERALLAYPSAGLLMVAPPAIEPAAQAVIAERRRQLSFGHDADTDDRLPRCWLLRSAHARLLDASDLVSGNARPDHLARARRRIVQAAALCLAEIDRIDRQLTNEVPACS